MPSTATYEQAQAERQKTLTVSQLSEIRARNAHLRNLNYQARIERYGTDPFMRFRLTHLQHRMRERRPGGLSFVAPAPAHHELTRDLHLLSAGRSPVDHLIGEMSRGFAKSTIGTEDFAIYSAAEEIYLNIVIVGASSNEKEYLTRQRNVINELDTNRGLLQAYPKLRAARDSKNQFICNTDAAIVLDNGCRIAAMPWGGNIRGQSYNGNRPDLVLIDDPETRKLVRSREQLQQGWDWFEHDLLGSEGAEGMHIVWLGTLLSYDCLLRRISLPESKGGKGWSGPSGRALHIPMLDEQGNSNWPAYWTPERIARVQRKHGPRAFAIERLLQVRPGEDKIYLEEWFIDHQWRSGLLGGTPGNWEYNGRPLHVYQAFDPAISLREDADFFAWATVGIDDFENLYLLDVGHAHIPFPKQMELVERQYDRWLPREQRTEDVAYQIALQQAVLAHRNLPLVGVKRNNTPNAKEDRLSAFAINVGNGKFFCNLEQPAQIEFMQEALEFPLGKTVDMLDAVETACEAALQHRGRRGRVETSERTRESFDLREEW